MPSLRAPQLIAFDAYGTLFDVMSVSARIEHHFPGQGRALAAALRDKQLEYSRLRALAGPSRYKPFWAVTRDALVYTLAAARLPATESVISDVLEAYREIQAYPEALESLQTLRARGFPLVVLSNGDPPMLQAALGSAGLSPCFQGVLSADAVQCFKVSPDVYALATAFAQCQSAQVLLVSSNAWDVAGAQWQGLQGFWVNRAHQPFDELDVVPTAQGPDLLALVEALSHPSKD